MAISPKTFWVTLVIILSMAAELPLAHAQASVGNSWANAYFRGTPNDWKASPMTFSKGLWRIIVRFGTSPSERFKIARFADWSESYPSQDYAITMGAGGYTITFDENSKAITVTKTSRTVEITFQCQRAFTSPGQSVYAIGSTAELGFWNRANAVLLSTTSAFPTRRKVIPIEINQKVEWKCLKRLESDPNKNVVYQPGPNNIFTASSPTTVFANF